MKSYTDLEQSKKLAEILPLESADMWWVALNWQETEYYVEVKQDGFNQPKKAIPCWSLAALLSVLPNIINNETLFIETSATLWHIGYRNIYTARADNPVDACVAMIEKLNELNLL